MFGPKPEKRSVDSHKIDVIPTKTPRFRKSGAVGRGFLSLDRFLLSRCTVACFLVKFPWRGCPPPCASGPSEVTRIAGYCDGEPGRSGLIHFLCAYFSYFQRTEKWPDQIILVVAYRKCRLCLFYGGIGRLCRHLRPICGCIPPARLFHGVFPWRRERRPARRVCIVLLEEPPGVHCARFASLAPEHGGR